MEVSLWLLKKSLNVEGVTWRSERNNLYFSLIDINNKSPKFDQELWIDTVIASYSPCIVCLVEKSIAREVATRGILFLLNSSGIKFTTEKLYSLTDVILHASACNIDTLMIPKSVLGIPSHWLITILTNSRVKFDICSKPIDEFRVPSKYLDGMLMGKIIFNWIYQ